MTLWHEHIHDVVQLLPLILKYFHHPKRNTCIHQALTPGNLQPEFSLLLCLFQHPGMLLEQHTALSSHTKQPGLELLEGSDCVFLTNPLPAISSESGTYLWKLRLIFYCLLFFTIYWISWGPTTYHYANAQNNSVRGQVRLCLSQGTEAEKV